VKKILIALDYDPSSVKVAETGFSIGKAMDAQIILLHVITEPTYYFSTDYSPVTGFTGYMDTMPSMLVNIESLKEASVHFLEKNKTQLGDSKIITMVREGDYAESILNAAQEVKADIIVIGSHSRNWMDEILMGSVTEKVLHHTTIPLFIIPTKKQKTEHS
jgi:nucleotide-binding universal stress UspA family protein